MRILMTFPFSIGLPGGGTYAYLQTARHLRMAGVNVTVMPLYSSGLKTYLRPTVPQSKSGQIQAVSLREIGIKVIPVNTNRLSFAFDSYDMKRTVSDYVQQEKVDVIISWHHEGAFLDNICKVNNIIFACRAAGNYQLIANHPNGRIWSLIAAQMLKQAFTKAEAVWSTSAFTRGETLRIFNLNPEKVKVIPEGIDPIFQTAVRERNENEPISRFLFFGMLTKNKGILDAIAAFGQLAAQGVKKWELHIAGWGDEEKLRQLLLEHSIADRVQILGKLDHPDLIKALEWSQVVMLPSVVESFGLAVAEAQASGVPVIAYKSGAVPEIIQDGITGWLVPVKRIDLLGEATIDSMKNPPRTYAMGLAGRENVAGRFTWKGTVEKMLTEIERIQHQQ